MPRTPYWIDTLVSTQLATGGVGAPFIDQDPSQGDARGVTLERIVLHLQFATTTEGGVEGLSVIDAGIGVASREAFALGVSGLPDPQSALERPARGWLWRDRIMVRETIQGTNLVSPGSIAEVRLDLRAKRKIDDGRMYLSLTNGILAGTGFAIQVSGIVRVLCLLP